MLDFFLLCILHGLLWFCFSAVFGIIHGRGAAKLSSSMALGLLSATAHVLVRYLWYT